MFDAEGDSLAFRLGVPEVPNFFFPELIGLGPDNQLHIDPVTGTVNWDAPQLPGIYHLQLEVDEYRGGIAISRSSLLLEILIDFMAPDGDQASGWKVFPNPTDDLLTIQSLDPSAGVTEVQLFDVSGRFLLSRKPEFPRSFYHLYLRQWPKGVYVVRVMNGAEMEHFRVVKR